MYKFSKLAAGSVIAATAALGGASVALADGYNAPRVRYESPSDWSGVYFGLHSGYQWSSIHEAFPDFGTSTSANHDTSFGGGHLGLQHQFGAVVLGVEGNFDAMFVERDGQSLCPNTSLNCHVSVNNILSVGGRLGWAAGHWMPYVTGGYANASLHYNTQSVAGANFLSTEEGRTRNSGWYLGGGVEWIISPGWTAGVEYRHYEFDNATTTTFSTQPVQGLPLETLRMNATTDSISARVSWKFGREYGVPLK